MSRKNIAALSIRGTLSVAALVAYIAAVDAKIDANTAAPSSAVTERQCDTNPHDNTSTNAQFRKTTRENRLAAPKKNSTASGKSEMPLLHSPNNAGSAKAPAAAPKPIIPDAKKIIGELQKRIPSMNDSTRSRALDNLLNSDLLNPAEIALALANSNNAKSADFGLDLMTAICVERPELLMPNQFLVAFAKRGTKSMPRISRIIDGTNDDFTREWACELYVEIYYHETPPNNPRHKKLAEIKKKEKKIYAFARDVASDPKTLRKIVKRKEHPANLIRAQWTDGKRFPLKMLAIIKAFELLSPPTIDAVSARVVKIVDGYDLRYDILGRIGGKILPKPPIPLSVELKVLSNAVFKDKYKDTTPWVSIKDGGFTLDELEMAVESGDVPAKRRMLRALKKIIGDVLRAKLVIGLGDKEIRLLRHFSQKTWMNGDFHWNLNTLTLENDSGLDASLILTSDSDKKCSETFILLKHRKFVWFLPPGDYAIESTRKSRLPLKRKLLNLHYGDFTFAIQTNLH